ncbi:ZNF34 protein, partial [Spizella passerina]|nr:ZNF34 protein [Spizella passerina]
CLECGNNFNQSFSLMCQQKIHIEEWPYPPYLQCRKRFSLLFHLIYQHIHTGQQPYMCRECGKSFSDCSNLICHLNIHTRRRLCECPKGGRSCCSSALTQHQESH